MGNTIGKIDQQPIGFLVSTDIWWPDVLPFSAPRMFIQVAGAILGKVSECGKTQVPFLLSVARMKIGSCNDTELYCKHSPKGLSLCFIMCSP